MDLAWRNRSQCIRIDCFRTERNQVVVRIPVSIQYVQEAGQKEIIGIVNIKQFISELLLNQNNAFLEILDEGSEEITFPYIRQYDNDIGTICCLRKTGRIKEQKPKWKK